MKAHCFVFKEPYNLRHFLSLALLFAGLCLQPASFARAATTTHPQSTHPGSVSDLQIQEAIQTKLAKSKIGKDGLKFHVSHGVVTWEGATNVMQHKGAATRMAKAAGATKVVNNIKVSEAAKSKATQQLKHAAVAEN